MPRHSLIRLGRVLLELMPEPEVIGRRAALLRSATVTQTDMNDSTQLIPLKKKSVQAYARASRRLRRLVGKRAPSAFELIAFELADRNPRDIAASYLDHLRDQERLRQIEPGFTSRSPQATRSRPAIVRETNWPGRRNPLASSDPTRN